MGVCMKRLLILLLIGLPLTSLAADYQSTLLVQTGKLRESDLIVRTVTDLEDNKICLAFYVRTTGTSPVMSCYAATSGFRSDVSQVGHFMEGKLVVRKIKDSVNGVSCLVAYVSTPGTSPVINCYQSGPGGKDEIESSGHVREGDLDVYRIVDQDGTKSCLIAYVSTAGTAPSLDCYAIRAGVKGGIMQDSYLREGDLIVRKIIDQANGQSCLITYVSTQGTSPYIFCSPNKYLAEGKKTEPATTSPEWKPYSPTGVIRTK
jgi:hypothetical protein